MNQVASEPILSVLREKSPVLWINPQLLPAAKALEDLPVGRQDIADASERLQRLAPLLQNLFSELEVDHGLIESPLVPVPCLQAHMLDKHLPRGTLYIKADHALPVAGSIKARGGIYEVLVIAEQLALDAGVLSQGGSPLTLNSPQARTLFSRHTIAVGSTGNLGLSIGVMASALGFNAVVHMSSDAKDWKKERLRKRGVTVVEHAGDYASAVAAGRRQSESDPYAHFIDDENSLPLFLGYSVAALRLKDQLLEAGILVDAEHPLFVYLPCGVGGAPGGITFGLKHVFGDHVHCFFAEPVDAPCMLVQLASGDRNPVSVYDIGLHNKTEADGLAVASASLLIADMMRHLVSGIFTVKDDDLFRWLYQLDLTESLKVEPSAVAGFAGPAFLLETVAGQEYLELHNLRNHLAQTSHVLWTTGGAFVPPQEYQRFYEQGEVLS